MTALAYYMPLYLAQKAEESDNQELLDYCEWFKIVNSNACLLDRTGSIKTPFATHSLYPIPEQTDDVADFGTLCIDRAHELAERTSGPIYFMYSGGLDSTSMLVAFNKVRLRFPELRLAERIRICTSNEAVAENKWAWRDIVLPYFKIQSTRDMLGTVDLDGAVYVQGENADQLFGSDRVFTETFLMHQPYSVDNLRAFVERRVTRPGVADKMVAELRELVSKCPLEVVQMRDFLWWLNFTCKWQAVAMRTLAFTNVFADGARVSLAQAASFETFFNTKDFQQLSMSGKLDRWGEEPTAYTYKAAARKFIVEQTGWTQYGATKMKAGSLYHVIRQRKRAADAIGYADGELFAHDLEVQ